MSLELARKHYHSCLDNSKVGMTPQEWANMVIDVNDLLGDGALGYTTVEGMQVYIEESCPTCRVGMDTCMARPLWIAELQSDGVDIA